MVAAKREKLEEKRYKKFVAKMQRADDSSDVYVFSEDQNMNKTLEPSDELESGGGVDRAVGTSESDSDDTYEPGFIIIKALGKQYLAQMDDGASHCFIDTVLAEKARALGFKITSVNASSVSTGNGVVLNNKCIRFHIAWDGGDCIQKFYIMPDLGGGIFLGRSFFKKNKMAPNHNRGGWSYQDRPEKVYPFADKKTFECHKLDAVEFADIACSEIPEDSTCTTEEKNDIKNVVRKYQNKICFQRNLA